MENKKNRFFLNKQEYTLELFGALHSSLESFGGRTYTRRNFGAFETNLKWFFFLRGFSFAKA